MYVSRVVETEICLIIDAGVPLHNKLIRIVFKYHNMFCLAEGLMGTNKDWLTNVKAHFLMLIYFCLIGNSNDKP